MKTNLRKKIKKYGGTNIIQLTSEELENYKWKIGDLLEIKEVVKVDEQAGNSIPNNAEDQDQKP